MANHALSINHLLNKYIVSITINFEYFILFYRVV